MSGVDELDEVPDAARPLFSEKSRRDARQAFREENGRDPTDDIAMPLLAPKDEAPPPPTPSPQASSRTSRFLDNLGLSGAARSSPKRPTGTHLGR